MDYAKIPGWCNFDELYQSVVDALPGGTLVEVGCFLGRSLCSLGDKAKKSGKPFRVVGVELGTGSGVEAGNVNHHEEAVNRGYGSLIGELHCNIIKCGLQDVVTVIVAPSLTAAALFPDNSLDFVFIDAQHTEEAVTADIQAWLRAVKPGHLIAGHDYDSHWRGVVLAVQKTLPGHEPWGVSSWKYTKPLN